MTNANPQPTPTEWARLAHSLMEMHDTLVSVALALRDHQLTLDSPVIPAITNSPMEPVAPRSNAAFRRERAAVFGDVFQTRVECKKHRPRKPQFVGSSCR